MINGQMLEEECVLSNPEEAPYEPREELRTERKGPYRVFYTYREGEADGPLEETNEATFGMVGPFKIPDGCFFMLSDNRDNSEDSRYRGCVPRELIWGTAEVIYWSQPPNSDKVRWERITKQIK